MPDEHPYPYIDDELIRTRAYAHDAGHIKLAQYGTKEDLQNFRENGNDKFRN